MLVEEAVPTHSSCWRTLSEDTHHAQDLRFHEASNGEPVDPYVLRMLVGTCGNLYRPLVHRLSRYPIPEMPLPPAAPGQILLDIGCNWGRWSIAAVQKGYTTVGIDPDLEAIMAARRVADQLGISAHYLVGDARFLPFRSRTFDVAFSYSVLQHFAKAQVGRALREIARTLKVPGQAMIQMPNAFGIRNVFQQIRRGFKIRFHSVRYWTPRELRATFENAIGTTTLSIAGFFSLNPQLSDADLMPPMYRTTVRFSEALKELSERVPALTYLADSIYVRAHRVESEDLP